jgi:hypothetical protein
MKALFTSKSSAGAWQIRGMQIAQTCDEWIASNSPSEDEIEAADVVCIVKKIDNRTLDLCKQKNKLLVLDVVDFWPQNGNLDIPLNRFESLQLVRKLVKNIEPDALIFPNFAMWAELRSSFPVTPSTFIYHHFRPEFSNIDHQTELRPITVIGYEGADYLGEWLEIAGNICGELGIEFVVNPSSLTDVDAVFSARGSIFRTFLNCNFKSNVKASNAIGANKPFLCHVDERSAHEVDPGTFLFFNNASTLKKQIEKIQNDMSFRTLNFKKMNLAKPLYGIEAIASEFDLFFHQVHYWHKRFEVRKS